MSTAQNRINYTFQKAKDRGVFTGSQEEFVANLKSDPEFADSVVNLTRDSLLEEGVPGADGLTNEKFFESIGEPIPTGTEKKKEDGSEESSVDGSAEADPFSIADQSLDDIISRSNDQAEYLRGVASGQVAQMPGNPFGFSEGKNKTAQPPAFFGMTPSDPEGDSESTNGSGTKLDKEAVDYVQNTMYSRGVVNTTLNTANPSNLDQAIDVLRNIEGNRVSEEQYVPILNEMFGQLGLKFTERTDARNEAIVEFPDEYNLPSRGYSLSTERDELISDLESVINQKRASNPDFDVEDRILTKDEYDRMMQAYVALGKEAERVDEAETNKLRESLASINDQISEKASEAKALNGSMRSAFSDLQEADKELSRLKSLAESSDATEDDINAYNKYVEVYNSAREAYQEEAKKFRQVQGEIDVLYNGNPMFADNSGSIKGLMSQAQQQAEERKNRLAAQSSEMQKALSRYSNSVIAEQYTFYGASFKSVVNGIENLLNGMTTLGGMIFLADYTIVDTLSGLTSDALEKLGAYTAARTIDRMSSSVLDGIEDVVFDGDASVEGVMEKSTEQASYVSQLSEALPGITSDASIYTAKESSWMAGAALGTLESLPAMLLPGAGTALGFFGMSFDSNMKEMMSEEYSGMSTANKLAVSTLIATAEAALEQLGKPKAIGGSGVFSGIIRESVKELGEDFSYSAFRGIIERKLRNEFKDFVLDVAGEGVTGLMQYMSAEAIKEISDVVNDKQYFQNPEDFIREAGDAFAQEAFGGFMISGVTTAGRAFKSGSMKEVDDNFIDAFARSVAGGDQNAASFRSMIEEQMKADIELGRADQRTLDQTLADFDRLYQVVQKLPKSKDGGVAANVVQIRALMELQIEQSMLEGSESSSAQKRLQEIQEQIQEVEAQAERTQKILSVQEDSASNTEIDVTTDSDTKIAIQTLTESENEALNDVIQELLINIFAEAEGETETQTRTSRVVIHNNDVSAMEAGLTDMDGGQWNAEDGTIHINLKAIERNRIAESFIPGVKKLKGFNETIREELNHSFMTQDFMSSDIEKVRAVKQSWIDLAKSDSAVSERMRLKEAVYRNNALARTEQGLQYIRENDLTVEDMTDEDASKIQSMLSDRQNEMIERELADEVVQEIASFAATGRLDVGALQRAKNSIKEAFSKTEKNGFWDKIGDSKRLTRQFRKNTRNGKSMSFDEATAIVNSSSYKAKLDEKKTRESRSLNPAALPTDRKFEVIVKYPGIASKVYGQGRKIQKTFNGKWDFINFVRRNTKDGSVPFFGFELVSEKGNREIDAYKIAGWNFKNSYKPITQAEAKVTLSQARKSIEESIDLGFDSDQFYADTMKMNHNHSFSMFKRDYVILDLLSSAGLMELKMPSGWKAKKAMESDASLAMSLVRSNITDANDILMTMKTTELMELSDLAKVIYPQYFKGEDVEEAVIRNSSRLTPATSKSKIDFFNPISSLPAQTQYNLMNLESSVSEYRKNKGWKIHPFEYLAVAITERSRDENGQIRLQSNEEASDNLVDIAWAVSDLAEKNQKSDPSRQFEDYQKARRDYMARLAQDGRMPEKVESFSPLLDMIVAITSNGEMEEVSVTRAQEMFEVMMAMYKSSGVLPSDGMSFVNSFERNTNQKLSSQRKKTMAFQLSNMAILASEFVSGDGSFDTKGFVDFARGKTGAREDFRRLHLRLSGGQEKSLKASTGAKIPNFALNLMGVDDALTIDAHVHRTVAASSGDLLTHGTLAAAAENDLFSKSAQPKAVKILDRAVSKLRKEGKSNAYIASEIKNAMTNLGFSGEKVIPYVKGGEVVTDSDGRVMVLSVEDYIKGNVSKAKPDNRSNVDAFMVAFVADLMNLSESRKEATDFMYERVGIKRSNSDLFEAENIRKANEILKTAHKKYNDYLKSQGKQPVSLAGFGQMFFVFGKINSSRRSREDNFSYSSIAEKMSSRDPMSMSSTMNSFDEVLARMTEDANEINTIGVIADSPSAIINFSKRDGDFFAEGYSNYGQIEISDGDAVFSQSGYVDGKFDPKYTPPVDPSSLKGARVYLSPFSEGSLVDGSLRTIKSADSIVYIKKEGVWEAYVDGELKLSNTELSSGDFDRWRDGKGGEIEVEGFRQKLQQETQQKVTREQAEAIYKRTNIPFRQTFWKSGQAEAYYNSGIRNSSRLRKPAERAAKSHELNSVKDEILRNPENYISKQNIKEAKEKLAEMSNDDLVAIMTDDALGRLQNRNDDLGVLAAAELIQRKVDAGDVQGVPALIEELGKMGTTAGRLLRHFREMKRATPQGLYSIINGMVERRGNKLTESQANRLTAITEALMYHQNRLKDLMERAIRGENVDNEIKQAKADLERAESELNNLVNKVVEKGWGEIGVSIMQGNLLTPMSQFTNVGANLANALIKIPVDLLAAPIDRLAEVLGMNVERKHRVSLGAYMYGLRRFGSGFVEAIDQIITGKEEAGTEWRVNRGFMPIRSFMAAWSNKDLPLGADGKTSASQRTKLFVQGTLGIPAEVMFRFLSLGDTPFRRMVEGFELYQAGINKGLEGEALKRFVKYPNKEDLAYAEREGRKLTFQEETTASKAAEDAVSFFERLFARGFDWMPGVDGRAFGKFFVRANMPYVRTPANILYDTLTFVTPYVAIPRILGSIAKGDTHAASENLAKLIIGTTTMQVAAKMVSLGLISGAIEWTEDEEKNIAYDQFPPNSINVSALRRWIDTGDSSKQEDDFFVGYNKLGVIGAIIGATVKSTTRDEAREEDPFSVNKIIRDAFGINAFGSIAYMMDQSFLQGMNNLISVISSSDADDFERQFERWYSSMFQATSSIVLPNSLSAYHRAEREYMPDTRITKDMPLAERLIKRMEYTIRDRVGANNMPIRINWKGEPITQTPRGTSGFAYQFFDIMKTRQGEADDVSQEIWRLYEETEELSSIVGTPYYATTRKVSVPQMIERSNKEREAWARTGKTYTFLDDPDFVESKVYLSVEEINKAMELSGKERYALARQLMNTKEYMSEMSNMERIEALNKIDEKFSGFKEIDEDGNFRSHTLYLLDVIEQKYLEMKEDE